MIVTTECARYRVEELGRGRFRVTGLALVAVDPWNGRPTAAYWRSCEFSSLTLRIGEPLAFTSENSARQVRPEEIAARGLPPHNRILRIEAEPRTGDEDACASSNG